MEDATVSQLLTILSTEIARDGGASLVIHIKDYVSNPKQLDYLIKQSMGSTKLLTFLESHPHIFDVNRKDVPHFVKLISQEYCQDLSTSNMRIEYETNMLREKVLYVLRKRAAKLGRRNLSKDDFPTVNVSWLSKECTVRLHLFLRVNDFYRKCYKTCHDVYHVGSKLWYELVQAEFESFLQEFLDLKDGKVYLPLEKIDKDFDITMLSEVLTELVHQDGGTQVSLSLLLHRNPKLKHLLGGRDFVTIVQDFPTAFSEIIITPYETDIELQSRYPTTEQQQSPVGRMAVDHEGLFSVASSKWGTAMANIMAWACREKLGEPEHVTVLDLTASIGGHALALAKTSFKRVIAIEIDPHRANLCQANMEKHRMDHKVQVRNDNAILLLPKLAHELSDQLKVVVIDPPWGGIHYKRELTRQHQQQLYLGQWSLDHVLHLVACQFSPTLVGLRLPINYVVSTLESTLRELELNFSVWNIRKLGPQLFVILVFYSKSNKE